ncbi:HAD family hydrolase [Saccharibacillus alkalitolerans]|uniref:HAD hydrolase-like protein n=1 Tax=Saccharibacillus alkalitolerans TaxID=2705290 RepID=A0ABX0FCA1_9BACL|nr:HAD family hydrolase [Saccharibacillus alkalitolerans]NGZ76901.1 HAD hydrolase-like protein [Saccharibacillus alkalitolerans]
MTQSLIFDMDGTLFQTDKILEISLEEAFDHLRSRGEWERETPIDAYREIMGVPLPKVWETLLPRHSLALREEVDAYFLDRLIDNINLGKGALYPGVEEVFGYLQDSGRPIYIASNGLIAYLDAIVRYYGLDRWVTEVFSIQQIESLNKSDLVRTIVDKYGITDGAVAGDRLSDIRAAKDNGLLAIGCRFDFAQADEMAQADRVIDDWSQLPAVLGETREAADI